MPEAPSASTVLFVGLPSIGGIKSLGWSEIDGANPAEYSVAVVDCTSLVSFIDLAEPNPGFFPKLHADLDHLGNRLAKLVATNGTVVVICGAKQTPERSPDFNCFGWLPIQFTLINRNGRSLEVLNTKWVRYVAGLTSWQFVFDVRSNAPTSGRVKNGTWAGLIPGYVEERAQIVPVAKNQADELLAVELTIQYRASGGGPFVNRGSFFLVPKIPDGGPIENAISLWLGDAYSMLFATEAPKWAESIPIPGLEEIEAGIKSAQGQINDLDMGQKGLEEKRDDKIRWRALVYETGEVLQDICEKAFLELGAQTRPSDVSDEFIVVIDGEEMLVEVKGVGKSASKGHLSQLVIDAEQRDEENAFPRIALVVNAWKALPLDQRGTNDKPWFPANVDEMAKPADAVLIGTDVLLAALRRHWEIGNGMDIVRQMKATVGRFHLTD